ncbi:MAG: nucleotidyltransferase domain-containing protein [Deltaproteobacteria bacterium]|nr:nucleotidyltransferase domain-containing protein [Deltaproteobacteria bacterium]
MWGPRLWICVGRQRSRPQGRLADATRALLGLQEPLGAIDRQEWIEDVEIDLTLNELTQVVRGLLKGNGNMLERVLDPNPLRADEGVAELRERVLRNLCRRSHAHYRGFATSQRQALDPAAPQAKKVLYVLRTCLTGAHLLETGEVVPDLTRLWSRYEFPEVPELIEHKRSAERGLLDASWIERIPALLDRAFARLDQAYASSSLPEQPAEPELLEEWLIARRLAQL